jgi:regulator of protease activity HflC (stomatin/prohibitin superfamily)
MKCCWCKYKRVAAMITRNSIRYDAPIKNCPTKDNVRISVDISLTFHVGPQEDECRNFVYRLGPTRLDELLAAESEEALRNFVHGVRLS